MSVFNFSMKNFLGKMVAAGYSPDSLDVAVQHGCSFRVDRSDNVSPERVSFAEESDDIFATHSRFGFNQSGGLLLKEIKVYCMTRERAVEPPKFVIDSLEALR